MHIDVTINGLDELDLTSIVGGEISYYDPETGATESQPRTLGDMVAEKLADRLYSRLDHEDIRSANRAFSQVRREMIEERLAPVLDAAVKAPIKKTNAFGEEIGAATMTLTELIMEEFKRITSVKQDHGRGVTMLQAIVREMVASTFKAELEGLVFEEKKKVIEAVQSQASKVIADAVAAGLAAARAPKATGSAFR